MNKKAVLLILIAVFVLLIGGASVMYDTLGDRVQSSQLSAYAADTPVPTDMPAATDAPAPTDEAGQGYTFAPDFTVYDRDGNEVHLHDFLGKPIVLNFWASWCSPCQMEMPDFNEKYLEIGEDVHFVMVNITVGRETMQTAGAFIDSTGYSFPVFYDTQSDAADTYGAYSLPTTYFINAEGYVIAYAVGAIDSETLQVGLDMVYFP